MARSIFTSPSCFFFLLLLSCYIGLQVLGKEYEYVNVSRVHPKKPSKVTHFHLYWQDIVNGTVGTSVVVLEAIANSSTSFGALNMFDDPLTVGPNISSKMVGRAEGFYAWVGQQQFSLMQVMNFKFTDGKYNGSTITIAGRNQITAKVREMPVIGGTGLFRFATGYAQAETYYFVPNGSDSVAIVEYNVYVIH